MIFLKTEDEIELLRQSNLLVGKTLAEVAKLVKPGVTTRELDKVAEEFIRDNGAIPTFKGFPNQYGDPVSYTHLVAPVTPGRIIIEAEGVSYEIAKEALRLAAQKLPITRCV